MASSFRSVTAKFAKAKMTHAPPATTIRMSTEKGLNDNSFQPSGRRPPLCFALAHAFRDRGLCLVEVESWLRAENPPLLAANTRDYWNLNGNFARAAFHGLLARDQQQPDVARVQGILSSSNISRRCSLRPRRERGIPLVAHFIITVAFRDVSFFDIS